VLSSGCNQKQLSSTDLQLAGPPCSLAHRTWHVAAMNLCHPVTLLCPLLLLQTPNDPVKEQISQDKFGKSYDELAGGWGQGVAQGVVLLHCRRVACVTLMHLFPFRAVHFSCRVCSSGWLAINAIHVDLDFVNKQSSGNLPCRTCQPQQNAHTGHQQHAVKAAVALVHSHAGGTHRHV
jgi:hypothetical protein